MFFASVFIVLFRIVAYFGQYRSNDQYFTSISIEKYLLTLYLYITFYCILSVSEKSFVYILGQYFKIKVLQLSFILSFIDKYEFEY